MKKDVFKGERSGKKILVAGAVLLIAGICIAVLCMKAAGSGEDVDFNVVKDSELPHDIASSIVPEYKTLERALACMDGDDVYVIVTRGEKPTSGFKVSVEKLVMEKKNNGENLVVYASFSDPSGKTAVSQIITYPVQVVKTNLNKLPESIELRIQYE